MCRRSARDSEFVTSSVNPRTRSRHVISCQRFSLLISAKCAYCGKLRMRPMCPHDASDGTSSIRRCTQYASSSRISSGISGEQPALISGSNANANVCST